MKADLIAVLAGCVCPMVPGIYPSPGPFILPGQLHTSLPIPTMILRYLHRTAFEETSKGRARCLLSEKYYQVNEILYFMCFGYK